MYKWEVKRGLEGIGKTDQNGAQSTSAKEIIMLWFWCKRWKQDTQRRNAQSANDAVAQLGGDGGFGLGKAS